MKLQTRIALPLLGGILLVVVIAQAFQFFSTRKTLHDLIGENLVNMQGREHENAENIFHSAEQAVAGSLERGEMAKFKRLLESQRAVKGLLEFSLYDREGVVSYASDASFLRKSLPPELKAQLLAIPEQFSRVNGDSIEIYQPQLINGECIRCHTAWKVGAIGGVTSVRISTAALTQMQQQSNQRAVALNRASVRNSLISVVAMSAVLLGLVLSVTKPLITTLNRLSANLSAGAEQTTAAAGQISAASQSLAEGASEQAASLEETSSSLEELASMTKHNAENSNQTTTLAKRARAAAEQGVTDMNRMNAAMEEIRGSSNDIAKIIKTIDEFAFQTNLLALNAAVEAARAGEAGLGFAVVADEVRALAQRSAQAAKETSAKIDTAISKTSLGVEISSKVAKALDEIVARAREVDALSAEVANASGEQSQGINQVNLAVSELDKVTQSNAASAEQSASAAAQLDHQAQAMQAAVAELLLLVSGKEPAIGTTSTPAPPIAPATRPRTTHTLVKV